MIDGAEDEDEDEDMSGSPFGFTPQEKKEKFRYQKVVKLVGEERLEGLFFPWRWFGGVSEWLIWRGFRG